jgi:PilZ domain-containing protein
LAAERRLWQRLPLAIPLFVRGVDKHGKDFLDFTVALNISAGGALVATRRALPRSSRLSLEISPSPGPQLIEQLQSVRSLEARVVRLTIQDSYNLCALRFRRPLI